MAEVRGPSIRAIQEAVAARLGLTVPIMLSRSRRASPSYGRHVAVWLARRMTGASLPAIGRQFGGRDHTTVLHSIRCIDQMITYRPDVRALVLSLVKELAATSPPRAGAELESVAL